MMMNPLALQASSGLALPPSSAHSSWNALSQGGGNHLADLLAARQNVASQGGLVLSGLGLMDNSLSGAAPTGGSNAALAELLKTQRLQQRQRSANNGPTGTAGVSEGP
jgi:hypothetical protein